MTLLEVIISLFLLSLLYLGIAMTHTRLMNTIIAFRTYSTASQQIINLAEQLKMATKQERSQVLNHWIVQTQQMLPQGLASVTIHQGEIKYRLFWGGASKVNCTQTTFDKQGCLYATL